MADCQDMEWDVRFDAAFAAEAGAFSRAVQLEIAALAGLLRRFGPQLRRPHCDTLKGSKHANMKELRFTLPDGEWRRQEMTVTLEEFIKRFTPEERAKLAD